MKLAYPDTPVCNRVHKYPPAFGNIRQALADLADRKPFLKNRQFGDTSFCRPPPVLKLRIEVSTCPYLMRGFGCFD